MIGDYYYRPNKFNYYNANGNVAKVIDINTITKKIQIKYTLSGHHSWLGLNIFKEYWKYHPIYNSYLWKALNE